VHGVVPDQQHAIAMVVAKVVSDNGVVVATADLNPVQDVARGDVVTHRDESVTISAALAEATDSADFVLGQNVVGNKDVEIVVAEEQTVESIVAGLVLRPTTSPGQVSAQVKAVTPVVFGHVVLDDHVAGTVDYYSVTVIAGSLVSVEGGDAIPDGRIDLFIQSNAVSPAPHHRDILDHVVFSVGQKDAAGRCILNRRIADR